MLHQHTVNIDQSLNELDKLSRSTVSDEEFFQRLLMHLSGIVGSASNTIMVPVLDSNWIIRAAVGPISETLFDSIRNLQFEL